MNKPLIIKDATLSRRAIAGLWLSALLAGIVLSAATPATAQDADEETTTPAELQEVITLGTRVSGRTVTESIAPIEIIDLEAIRSTGASETGKLLQLLAPSFNFSSTTISDGTDIIRPATLRGLGPDQVLVLVNGKRRHQQALVNVQQTIGRGSAGTDINAIPLSAIDHIEVLRDGAAAQYGSDAIAGVINIVLKNHTRGTEFNLEAGQFYENDGETYVASVNQGLGFADGGFANLTLEYRDRGETNRAGSDVLRVAPPRVTQRIGDAESENLSFWLNSAYPIGNGELYAFGGASRRDGDSAGFFRPATDDRTVPDLYPDGFLPNILTEVDDEALAVGFRSELPNGWAWDLSVNRGLSEFNFMERNSVNVSYWFEPGSIEGGIFGESPTSADTGTLRFDQTTANLDFAGEIDWNVGYGPLFVGFGTEYRLEGYQIIQGDPVSFQYGRTNDRSIVILNQNGTIAAPGIQGFPGFTPATEVDADRESYAFYVDTESEIFDRFQLGAALRFEDFTDFGNTLTGKVSGRYDFDAPIAIRGTVSNGFRAPSVQQQFYSQVSTNLNAAGVLTDTLTARQDSSITRAFGIQPLEEETSASYSVGIVTEPLENLKLTVDLYRIDIDDRIVFSSNIQPEPGSETCTDPDVCPIAVLLRPFNVGQVLFFTNAIDTETTGLDVVGEYIWELRNDAELIWNGTLHFNETEVTSRRSQSPILSPEQLFDGPQVTLVEEGQPQEHFVLSGTYNQGRWSTTVRANYFGEVAGEGFTPGIKQTWGAKTLVDLAVTYNFTDAVSLTVGGNNIFDTYPDDWDDMGDPNTVPFPGLGFTYCWETCPFGMNGGYYFARMNWLFDRRR
ncbi:MAG TPA: TonB-dependent receptor [Gammaproteobacteria bacterium]|nr:TonB-dependent receptor [Gammaproteobacteria bacterium]